MPRGNPKLKVGDPANFTRALRGGRTDLTPYVQPTLMAWILMRQRGYLSERAKLLTSQQREPTAARASYINHLAAMAGACATLLASVPEGFSRVEWLAAVATVEGECAPAPFTKLQDSPK